MGVSLNPRSDTMMPRASMAQEDIGKNELVCEPCDCDCVGEYEGYDGDRVTTFPGAAHTEVCFRAKENRMSIQAIRKAQQITVAEMATRAAAGVSRALAARQAAGRELSSEELSQVNGGFTLRASIFDGPTWGMIPPPEEIIG